MIRLTTLTQIVPEPGSDSLGAAIRRRRRRLALSLDDLARKAGLCKSYLSFIERDIGRPPSPAIVAALEESLALDPMFLFVRAVGFKDRREDHPGQVASMPKCRR